jgi:hypothetical protein
MSVSDTIITIHDACAAHSCQPPVAPKDTRRAWTPSQPNDWKMIEIAAVADAPDRS